MAGEEKVLIYLRIPKSVNDKLSDIVEKGEESTKTEIIVAILSEYFFAEKNTKDDILKSISDVFSVENKTLMPLAVYKKLQGKSDYEIKQEIKKGIVEKIDIKDIPYVMFEAKSDIHAANVELLIQKKSIVMLESKLQNIEKYISSSITTLIENKIDEIMSSNGDDADTKN